MTNPTVAERIDPASPHYDAEFAALRRAAIASYEEHQYEMLNNPEYRRAMKASKVRQSAT